MRFALVALVGAALAAGARADGVPPGQPCEVCPCEAAEKPACRVVPATRPVTKVIYTTKDDPFCLRRCSCGHKGACGDGCGVCPRCRGPFGRKILVKTVIVCQEPTVKCVAEKPACEAAPGPRGK